MVKHSIRLSSAEIGGLWANFILESMTICLLKYFLYHNQDEEIKPLLEKALKNAEDHIQTISAIFDNEHIPLPDTFTDDEDINYSAPPLFYDMFGLSFVYMMNRLGMINASFQTANVAREDVLNFYVTTLNEAALLYKESTELMLSKGLYDRPPMIPYPKQVEYIEKLSYLSGMIKKRPLNSIEITEIFFNTERNYFSILLCTALLQVVDDKEIKQFIKEGKEISEKQIRVFQEILEKEQLLGNTSTNMEVTDSTVLPFSNKLIVTLFASLNAIDITLLGHALSVSMRSDLVANYQKYISEILIYAGKGFNLLVDRGWSQQPPMAPNRKELENMK
jgi:ferritin-like metal-binding protein YciE